MPIHQIKDQDDTLYRFIHQLQKVIMLCIYVHYGIGKNIYSTLDEIDILSKKIMCIPLVNLFNLYAHHATILRELSSNIELNAHYILYDIEYNWNRMVYNVS